MICLDSLSRRANARNVSFKTLYGSKFTLSAQLILLLLVQQLEGRINNQILGVKGLSPGLGYGIVSLGTTKLSTQGRGKDSSRDELRWTSIPPREGTRTPYCFFPHASNNMRVWLVRRVTFLTGKSQLPISTLCMDNK